MAEVMGKLLSDWLPNGKVRVVFIADVGGGNETPLTIRNLDTAEQDFVRTYGMTPERAAKMRAQLERNKVFCATMTLDDEVAASFRIPPLRKDRTGRPYAKEM